MYIFYEFSKLIILLLVIAIFFLVYKRFQDKKKEDFEDRDN